MISKSRMLLSPCRRSILFGIEKFRFSCRYEFNELKDNSLMQMQFSLYFLAEFEKVVGESLIPLINWRGSEEER